MKLGKLIQRNALTQLLDDEAKDHDRKQLINALKKESDDYRVFYWVILACLVAFLGNYFGITYWMEQYL